MIPRPAGLIIALIAVYIHIKLYPQCPNWARAIVVVIFGFAARLLESKKWWRL